MKIKMEMKIITARKKLKIFYIQPKKKIKKLNKMKNQMKNKK